ncbi:MAG: SRPBCC family protein [Alphaproteobacteria bacterium]
MKIVLRLLTGAVLLAVILFAVGLMLPRHVGVERRIVINAPAEVVYLYVNDLRRFNTWSPWAKAYPDMVFRFSGPEAGVGARMDWESGHPDLGSGGQEIVEAVPDRFVRSVLDFGEKGSSMIFWRLDPVEDGDATRVTWRFTTDMGYNPIGRYRGLAFDDMVGRDYEKGLDALKDRAESHGHAGS